jgi:hypothetical protein
MLTGLYFWTAYHMYISREAVLVFQRQVSLQFKSKQSRHGIHCRCPPGRRRRRSGISIYQHATEYYGSDNVTDRPIHHVYLLRQRRVLYEHADARLELWQ